MKILLSDEDVTEEVHARELGGGRFELLETPLFFCEQAALGDIVRLRPNEDGSHELVEVLERPYRHHCRFIPGEYGHSKAIFEFGEWIVAQGGRWEAVMGGFLILHFPRGKRVRNVKPELTAHLERFEHSEERAELLREGRPGFPPKPRRRHGAAHDSSPQGVVRRALAEESMSMQSTTAYRLAAGLAFTAVFLIVWLSVAAGLLGIEDDDPANLLYVGVLAIGCVGAILARFRPRGMALALLATAAALAVVGAFAMTYPNTASPLQIALLHGLLVGLFAGAALLFRHSAAHP